MELRTIVLSKKHKKLCQELFELFYKKFLSTCFITANRPEGADCGEWLQKNLLTNSRGQEVHVDALFRGMKPMEERILCGSRELMGAEVYLSALKMPDGELLIVATDELSGFAIKRYGLRWQIETLFACLKSKGFNFEDTHITKPERIEKLLVLLTIAFCWPHRTGE